MVGVEGREVVGAEGRVEAGVGRGMRRVPGAELWWLQEVGMR